MDLQIPVIIWLSGEYKDKLRINSEQTLEDKKLIEMCQQNTIIYAVLTVPEQITCKT